MANRITVAVVNTKVEYISKTLDGFIKEYNKGKEKHQEEHQAINDLIHGDNGKGFSERLRDLEEEKEERKKNAMPLPWKITTLLTIIGVIAALLKVFLN